jgi:pimeloyl-ACP methyl ester carboxylesterase
MARDVAALLDHLEIQEKIVLCGLSMGGYAAQRFAREYSDRLRALVLCDTRAEADAEETKANRDRLIALARTEGSAAVMEMNLPNLLGKTTHESRPEIVEQVRALGTEQSPVAIANGLVALRDRPDATAWLEDFDIPTLLIFGDEDSLAPSHVIETLYRGIPGAWLERIRHAGHLPNLENPRVFNQVLQDFLHSLL